MSYPAPPPDNEGVSYPPPPDDQGIGYPPPPGGSGYTPGGGGGGYGPPPGGGYGSGGGYGPPEGGYPPSSGGYGYGGPGGYAQPVTNKKALWSMILGILSLVCCVASFGFIPGIPAIILSRMGGKEIAASGGTQTGSGMATAGLILGVLGTVVSILFLVLTLTGRVTAPTSTTIQTGL